MRTITNLIKKISIILFLIFVFDSCTKDTMNTDIKTDFKAGDLVEFNFISTVTAASLKTGLASLTGLGLNIDQTKVTYDIDVYRVTYKTLYNDKLIDASGLVALPKNTSKPFSFLSFQHGTISQQIEAPTNSWSDFATQLELSLPACLGLITVMPDFIGFGSSSNIFHTYFIKLPIAQSVVDNLKAAKQLALKKNILINKKLVLIGYSEGGYATMATHQYIESTQDTNFQLMASYPGAGGYDIKSMLDSLREIINYSQPFYIGNVILAYQNYYKYTSPSISDFFRTNYASLIPNLYNGNYSGDQINSSLTTNLPILFNENFKTNINTDARFTNFRNYILNNSLINWRPIAPMVMYHGTSDSTVFYSNSVKTYNNLIQNGANPSQLQFINLEGDHISAEFPYFNNVINKIINLNIFN